MKNFMDMLNVDCQLPTDIQTDEIGDIPNTSILISLEDYIETNDAYSIVAVDLDCDDPEMFSSGMRKLSTGMLDDINTEEARLLVDAMMTLYRNRISIQESNQDNKLKREGDFVPNEGQAKKPMTPAEMRAKQDKERGHPEAKDDDENEKTGGEEAEDFVKQKGIK